MGAASNVKPPSADLLELRVLGFGSDLNPGEFFMVAHGMRRSIYGCECTALWRLAAWAQPCLGLLEACPQKERARAQLSQPEQHVQGLLVVQVACWHSEGQGCQVPWIRPAC